MPALVRLLTTSADAWSQGEVAKTCSKICSSMAMNEVPSVLPWQPQLVTEHKVLNQEAGVIHWTERWKTAEVEEEDVEKSIEATEEAESEAEGRGKPLQQLVQTCASCYRIWGPTKHDRPWTFTNGFCSPVSEALGT